VLFHLCKSVDPAGYLGVDMFFVVSGYLITSILWKEMTTQVFKISTFYDRRIRRILPALLLLIAVVTVISTVILLPADLVGYGRSLLSSLAFVANIYFWRDTDYFSRAAETKPLLHLWSLGVEEQFYILFPPILWLVARLRRQAVVLWCVGAATIVSLVADIALRRAGGGPPAFFLLPPRAWELGIGALVAVLPEAIVIRSYQAHALSLLGAGLIIASMLNVVSPYAVLPAALPLVFGTGLIILAGRHRVPVVSRVLALRPLVFLGWISYSLYLWHWPVIVLGQYYLVRAFHLGEATLAVLLMLGLAVASWYFVERPFRDRGMPVSRVCWTASVAVIVLAASGVGLIAAHGLPNRLNAAAANINEAVGTNYRCEVYNLLSFGSSRACIMNLPSRNPADADLVLLGNSHAQMYAPLWNLIAVEHGQRGLLVPLNGCLPTVTVNIQSDCFEPARRNLAAILSLPRAKTVVLGVTWNYGPQELVRPNGIAVDNMHDAALVEALDDLIGILGAADKRIILIGPIAEPGYDIASNLSRNLAFGHVVTEPTTIAFDKFRQQYGSAIGHFEARKDMVFVRPDSVQCSSTTCSYVIGDMVLFADGDHISAHALSIFRPLFEDAYRSSQSID
jgi:peptidoglycan/LPS O-acetylase OafA/YrhL